MMCDASVWEYLFWGALMARERINVYGTAGLLVSVFGCVSVCLYVCVVVSEGVM